MLVDLTPEEAIAAASGIAAYHKHIGKHYVQCGVPRFMQRATRDHIEVHESAHATLLAALRAEGYIMRDGDLTPLDIDAIMALPYTPPEHST